jgi:RNA-directed DNA polymerase
MSKLKANLFQAYYNARKNKRNTHNQLQFEINYENKLWQLYEEIVSKTYSVGKSITFIVDKPVKREIFTASFRDRVIHHLIFLYINSILEPKFINDSYSCRKNKGTHYGILQASKFLKEVSSNYTKNAYVLKLDIKGYFMSINKNKLILKLKNMITRQEFEEKYKLNLQANTIELDYDTLFYLIEEVIYNDPTQNCSIKGTIKDWDNLPDSKSLFKTNYNCGLPIGNLTSQLFSNVYLNSFDYFVKKELHCSYYGRYVDDFFIMDTSKERLKEIKKQCFIFLKEQEGLLVHPKKIYLQHYSKGFPLLGVYIKPHRIYIAKRTKTAFKKVIYYYTNVLATQTLNTTREINEIRSVINSYLGLLSHYQTYKLRYQTLFSNKPSLFYLYGSFDSAIKRFKIDKSLILSSNQ